MHEIALDLIYLCGTAESPNRFYDAFQQYEP
jgi:hypothetical protein